MKTRNESLITLRAGTIFLLLSLSAWACNRSDANGIDPNTVEAKYGLSGAHVENVMTPDGPMGATVVPITMGNGQKAELVIPNKASSSDNPAYIRDDKGLHPIALNSPKTPRAEMVKSAAVVETRPAVQHKKKRTWEKEALIIGGSAGAGAAIGGVAGGGKGAAIGATAGGVGGLIYDVLTRNK